MLRESIEFAKGKRRKMKQFDHLIIQLCAVAPIKHLARFIGIGWDLVESVFKAERRVRRKKRKLPKVPYLAVDEFAIRRAHRYMTIVMDLKTEQILHMHHGEEANSLMPFLKQLRRKGIPLGAVAMDMWPAYISLLPLAPVIRAGVITSTSEMRNTSN